MAVHGRVRPKVARFVSRPNDGPSSETFPLCWSAELECGHVKNLGVQGDYRPKRMVCWECEEAHAQESE